MKAFIGGFHAGPCDSCEVDTVGSFPILPYIGGAFISGTFGAQFPYSSAAVDLYLGVDRIGKIPSDVPEPAAWALMLIGAAGIGAALRGSREKRPGAISA